MKNKKSAKDLAFERDLAKFRKEIRELKREKESLSIIIMDQKGQIQKAEIENQQLKEWNERLLEYMDMPEEEMRKRIENERSKDEILDTLGEFGQIFRRFGIL